MEEETLIQPPDLPDEPQPEEAPVPPPVLVAPEPEPAPPLPAPYVEDGVLYANGEAISLDECVGCQYWQPDLRTTVFGLLTTYQKQHKRADAILTKRGVYKQFPVADADTARNLEMQIQAVIDARR